VHALRKQHRVWVNLKDDSLVQGQWMGEEEARFELNRLNLAMNFSTVGTDSFVSVGNAATVRARDIVGAGVEEQEQT
jgi:hypothetical protein